MNSRFLTTLIGLPILLFPGWVSEASSVLAGSQIEMSPEKSGRPVTTVQGDTSHELPPFCCVVNRISESEFDEKASRADGHSTVTVGSFLPFDPVTRRLSSYLSVTFLPEPVPSAVIPILRC